MREISVRRNRKYLVAVALLVVLAVVFGLAGTVPPESEMGSSEESSDSFTQFGSTQATYDSGEVDERDFAGLHSDPMERHQPK